jgi:hypothetical protein
MHFQDEIKVIIPSHKRAGRVRTLQHIRGAALCIPKAQEAEYREHYPETELVCHPDDIIGLALKRQWICDHFDNVFMLDDDIAGMYRLWVGAGSSESLEAPRRMDPQVAYERIQAAAITARDMNAHIFGFANSYDTRQYDGIKPFTFTGYRNIYALGFLNWSKSALFFPKEAVVGQDYWICGLNAYHHRFFFVDGRFGFQQMDTFKNPGGLSEFRNFETEKKVYCWLKRSFGDAIERKDKSSHMTNVRHPYMRHLKVPF